VLKKWLKVGNLIRNIFDLVITCIQDLELLKISTENRLYL